MAVALVTIAVRFVLNKFAATILLALALPPLGVAVPATFAPGSGDGCETGTRRADRGLADRGGTAQARRSLAQS